LIPDETAGNAFIGINDQVAAIYKSSGVYKSVFMGFPFEGLSSLADRQEVLSRFLEWCSGGSSVFVPIVIR
jgi:hypothetical protein